MAPEPFTIPERTFELPTLGTNTIPEMKTHLWGEPLGYVTVEQYHRVADLVMHLPTDIEIPEGEWDSAEGFCDFLITAGLERTL